jgi:hypothetical protein
LLGQEWILDSTNGPTEAALKCFRQQLRMHL